MCNSKIAPTDVDLREEMRVKTSTNKLGAPLLPMLWLPEAVQILKHFMYYFHLMSL